MSKTLLDVQHLHLSYDGGKTYILRDISFSLYSGEILSIIGKNGTGKSSLLKAIAGIQKPDSGKIEKFTKKISYVPQKLHLEKSFPLKVEEFLKIFNSSLSASEIHASFIKFGIEKLSGRNIHSLSGGEFQKVLILNSLLSKPDLLLLDEPTSGIDIIGEEQFYEQISQVKKIFPDIAIILVSHNLHLVYKNSDRVICLHDNNFCCHGTPAQVQENEKIKEIFGDFLTPYEHHPHTHHHHTH